MPNIGLLLWRPFRHRDRSSSDEMTGGKMLSGFFECLIIVWPSCFIFDA